MVTTYKINENEMGNRGSKSEFNLYNIVKNYSVKEQRVDGCRCRSIKNNYNFLHLRCTLMDFERNYQVRILAKQLLNKPKPISTLTLSNNLINPWFITGFTDAEGSFIISVYPNNNSKLKWSITPYFSIHLHIKDTLLLLQIKNTLGVGNVRKNSENTVLFRVENFKDIQVIIEHFDQFPLMSEKLSDYKLFKECYNIIKDKKHLTKEGFEKILALKYNLNKGLPEKLKKAFPNIIPVERPKFKNLNIPDPNWISGFCSGDSSFSISIEKSNNKIGKRVRLIFETCLHIKDKQILINIKNYLLNYNIVNKISTSNENNNNISKHKYIYDSSEKSILQIKNYSDVQNKIIPFFNKYPILGIKILDFNDFKLVSNSISNKTHLTKEGLKKINDIVSKMNLSRSYNKDMIPKKEEEEI